MWSVVSYLVARQGLVEDGPGTDFHSVENFKEYMLQVLVQILTEASEKIDQPDKAPSKKSAVYRDEDEFSDWMRLIRQVFSENSYSIFPWISLWTLSGNLSPIFRFIYRPFLYKNLDKTGHEFSDKTFGKKNVAGIIHERPKYFLIDSPTITFSSSEFFNLFRQISTDG